MVLLYGEAKGNSEAARQLYIKRFPTRTAPNATTITLIVQNLKDYGNFMPEYEDCCQTTSAE